MSDSDFVTAFAPASIGNIGVGFDMLGVAIVGAGDRVSARRVEGEGVSILEVRGMDGKIHSFLPPDAADNTASIAAAALWQEHGGNGAGGLEMIVRKGVPLQSGMGSSAASAVAGVVAANALLETPLGKHELLKFAIEGEKYASKGIHADNVAPSLLGGLIFCPPSLLPTSIALNVPKGISSVLLHPDLQVDTAQARLGLARGYSLEQWVTQQGYLGGFILACERGDTELMGKCLRDIIIEPQRSAAVPCFDGVKNAAMANGALGCSLSGSGPSIFALCDDNDAAKIAIAMEQECRNHGYKCRSWISPMAAPGACVEESA